MPSHKLIDSRIDKNKMTVWASIDGFPGWVVSVAIVSTPVGPVAADLSVYPWEPKVTWRREAGAVVVNNPSPARDHRGWSGRVGDVPQYGLTARLLRRVNVGELVGLAQRQAHRHASVRIPALPSSVQVHILDPALAGRDWKDILEDALAPGRAIARRLSVSRERPGRKGNGIDHYLDWAGRFVLKVEQGSRQPIAELAREHGESPNYVRDTISDARHRHGLLTRPGRGRVGGQLTDKAVKLLAQRSAPANTPKHLNA